METMELLVETLQHLSLEDFAEFRTLAEAELSLVTCSSREAANVQDVVGLMVKSSSGECVEAVRTVLMKMDRLDLVERLSAADLGAKDKLSVDEGRLSLDQKVEKLSSDLILMLETLKDLSDEELQEFKRHLNQQKLEENEAWQETADLVDVVIFIMQTYGKESLMVTRDILENIRRKDLVQKLSSSSASRGQRRSALIHKVATMAAVRQQLLETLDKLTQEEYFIKLKESLSDSTLPEMKVTRDSTLRTFEFKPERAELADELMEKFGRLSVKMMDQFLIKINRKDLAENLEDESSEDKPKRRPLAKEHQDLSEKLQKLTWKTFEKFKSFLRFSCFEKSLPQLPKSRLDEAATPQYLAWLMLTEFFHWDVWGIVRDVQTDMTDLDQWLTENCFKSQDKSSVGRKLSLDQMMEKQSSDFYLMLETLKDLSDDELETFKRLMSPYYNKLFCEDLYSYLSRNIVETADLEDTVIFIMQTWGKYSVMVVRSLLKRFRRKDLVQKLSSSSASRETPLGKQSAQIHKVATMAAVKDVLLETLEDLNEPEFMELKLLLQFTNFQRNIPLIPWNELVYADRTRVVNLLTNKYDKESVEMIREVLLDLNRTDLALRLPETSSASKEKLSMKLNSALLQKVEKLEFVTELLLETLDELDEGELRMFWETTPRMFHHHSRYMPHWSVEATMDVLKQMKKDDLVEKLSGRSSGPKEKPSASQGRSALSHKVATMAAVRQQLLETLEDLNEPEFVELKLLLQFTNFQRNIPLIQWYELVYVDRTRVVNLLTNKYGKQSVEMIREVLLDLNRTDLALRLPETSSASKEKLSIKLNSALLQKVEKLEFVTELLLETLDELDEGELRMFWETTEIKFQFHSRYMAHWRTSFPNVQHIVVGLVLTFSHQTVEKTMDVLKQMKKDDLVEKLSGRSSGPKEKPSAGQRRSALIHKVATMAAVRQQLLETLDKLTQKEYFKFRGSSSNLSTRLKFITKRAEVIDEMMDEFGQHSVEMVKDLLIKINRKDLAEDLLVTGESSVDEDAFLKPETPSMVMTDPDQMQLEKHISPAATSTEVDPSGSGSLEQDSSSWTKVDPELDGSSPDQGPTYSLQSAAGHFECSVSGLRWVCRETVGFRYRFCSWDEHMGRMESRGFRPAGPLLDISVLTGEVMEVQLPHWVCTDDIPELLKNFAVLHVNDCGDVLEKATRVTKTHVGLAEPVFSLLGALIHFLYSPRISCNTLMYYQPKTSYLKMRVYLIPLDPALKQSIHREESSTGYEMIKKPRPDKPLQLGQGFSLKATEETARIQPQEITLRHDSQDPNFYEVFIENPAENFNLELLQTHSEKVWFCEIRKDDHPKSGSTEVGEFSTEAAAVEAKAASFSTEMPRSIKQLLAETLEDLTQENLDKFVFQLLDRSAEPRVRRWWVEGKSRLDIVDVLVSTFTEDKAVDVTAEILRNIGCNHQADSLVKEQHGG